MSIKLISKDISVLNVLEKFDLSDDDYFILVDENQEFKGSIFDKLLRSIVLEKDNLFKSVEEFSINNFDRNYFNSVFSKDQLKKIEDFIKREYKKNLIDLDKTFFEQISVVIMAGGIGARLKPLTEIIPKPLLPIGNKTILEHIIESFLNYNIKRFFLTVNYKAEFIKAYISELNPNYLVDFIEEEIALGTAGSLKFLEGRIDKPFFVSNCDVFVKTSFRKIYDFHLKNNFDLTLVGALEKMQIPFGVCQVAPDFSLIQMHEKPVSYHIVNVGLYVINPSVLRIIPYNKFYDITDLIEDMKKQGMRIGVYPISHNSWVNLGSKEDYIENRKKYYDFS